MPQKISRSIEQANERIAHYKKERRGFNNLFNGYRTYCNLQIEYWKSFIEYCKEGLV